MATSRSVLTEVYILPCNVCSFITPRKRIQLVSRYIWCQDIWNGSKGKRDEREIKAPNQNSHRFGNLTERRDTTLSPYYFYSINYSQTAHTACSYGWDELNVTRYLTCWRAQSLPRWLLNARLATWPAI